MNNRPVTDLKGAGPRLAEKLERLGVHTCEDLLFHLPLRYQDRTRVTPIGGLRPEQTAVIEGKIMAADVVYGRRRSLLVRVGDGTGMISLRFFHFSAGQKASLEPGRAVRAFGETRPGASGLELYHPEYESAAGELAPLEKRLTPVYPATEGVSQPLLRRLVDQTRQAMERDPPRDLMPPSLTGESGLPTLQQALTTLHAPSPDADVEALLAGTHPAIQRLVIEELVAHQLGLLEKRAGQRCYEAPVLDGARLMQQLLDNLPFELTGAQQRVIDEIRTDLGAGEPMLRLVQGDVGSGKTLVAAAAALICIESGYQVALMAPTEVLAEQHLQNFRAWLEPLGLTVVWLAGSLTRKARHEALEAIAEGRAALVVGTHALFQDSVTFRQLGLTLIDEQHRFGVHQRLALRDKGRRDQQVAHQLVMTATPIPRTLAMSAYGDLDTSVIDELPPGRKPIETLALPDNRRDEVVERVRRACLDGARVYWVCTLIEESEALQASAAEDSAAALAEALPELAVELVHGRMKPADKARHMERFASGDAQVLVATTVIEVGVDVPEATLMVMENAERLGLAQLHQLRGRVGRGAERSYCVLLYQGPLSETARRRLQVMRETSDGFRIAEEDLRLRGPGEWLGTRQAGDLAFRIVDLLRDEHWLEPARSMAERLRRDHPEAVPELLRRWVRGGEAYAEV